MTVNYTKISPQPALRDPSASGVSVPGIYPDELAVTLNDMNNAPVAVYSDVSWMPNNEGAVIYASARYCDASWCTILSGTDQHEVVTEKRFNCDAGFVAAFGIDALAKEAMLAMLGEAPGTHTVTNADGTTSQVPILNLDDTTRINASIRHAIALTQSVGPTNAGALL